MNKNITIKQVQATILNGRTVVAVNQEVTAVYFKNGEELFGVGFEGRDYTTTGKTGKSMRTGEQMFELKCDAEEGFDSRIWTNQEVSRIELD